MSGRETPSLSLSLFNRDRDMEIVDRAPLSATAHYSMHVFVRAASLDSPGVSLIMCFEGPVITLPQP
jgi:hypothetical protein